MRLTGTLDVLNCRAASRMQVPPEQWNRVEARLPFLDYLPPDERPRLRQMALEFLTEKEVNFLKMIK